MSASEPTPPLPPNLRGEERALMMQGGLAGGTIALGFLVFHASRGSYGLALLTAVSAGLTFAAAEAARRDRPQLSRGLMFGSLGIVVTGITAYTGGVQSPALLWALLLPAVAAGSGDAGLIARVGAATSLLPLLFLTAEHYGLLPAPVPEHRLGRAFLVGTLVSLAAAFSLVVGRISRQRVLVERERTRALEEIERARARAEAANDAKSRFLSHMSHEIRTPLNGVLGLAQLLRDSPLSREQAEQVAMLLRSGESLLDLISEVLDFSKVEADRIELEAVPFSPAEVVCDSAELLAGAAARKGVELVVDPAPELPAQAVGDPARLRQVLSNLVANAVKFTDHGSVTVTAALEGVGAGGPCLRVDVVDTGVGIAPEALPRLFQPFVQADTSTTRRYGGTGLGLAICKRLVELMGGELGATSAVGVGSTFTVRLPLRGATAAARPDLRLAGRRVLVVEAHPAAARVALRVLAAAGARVEAVPAAGLAARVGQGGVDLLVVGDRPGDTDAIEAVEALHAAAQAPPSVWVWGAPDPERRARVAVLGHVAHLARPVRAAALLDACAQLHEPAPALPAPDAAAERTPEAPPGPRVLVAEDNAVNQLVVVSMLRRLRCDVEAVDTGVAAVRAVGAGGYDLVLMDCQMPELDGIEATRQIRAGEPPGRRLPIFALTANALPDQRAACIAAGMDGFLTKPVRLAELQDAVESAGQAPADPPPRVLDELDPRTAANIVQLFRRDAPQQVDAVLAAVDSGDPAAGARAAHTLKSTAATLGLSALSAHARRVQTELVQADPAQQRELAEGLRRRLFEAQVLLARWHGTA